MKKSQLLVKLNPRSNRATRTLLLAALLTVSIATPVLAQGGGGGGGGTGVPIIDGILDFIDSYKLPLAILGVAIIAVGLLVKPVFPDLWDRHKNSIVYMVLGGILLTMIPTVAGLIVGS
ncbi:MAG TPA: hypothetical protein ENJ31_08985 [Anaerolineae bacterium]|nr:hypothetical protein [Anaerolineae bacterium]